MAAARDRYTYDAISEVSEHVYESYDLDFNASSNPDIVEEQIRENEQLLKRIASLENTSSELKKDMQRVQHTLRQTTKDTDTKEQLERIARLQIEKEDAEEKYRALLAKFDHLEKHVEKTEAQCSTLERERDKEAEQNEKSKAELIEKNKSLAHKLHMTSEELVDTAKKLNKANKETESLKNTKAALESRVEKLMKENAELQEQIRLLTKGQEDLKDNLRSSEAYYTKRIAELRLENEKLQKQCDKVDTRNVELEKRVAATEATNKILMTAVNDVNKTMGKLTSEIKSLKQEVTKQRLESQKKAAPENSQTQIRYAASPAVIVKTSPLTQALTTKNNQEKPEKKKQHKPLRHP